MRTQILDYTEHTDKKSKISSNFVIESILNLLDKISSKENYIRFMQEQIK